MNEEMIVVTDEWRETFPGACVGFMALSGVLNPPSHAGLETRKEALLEDLISRYGSLSREELGQLPVLQAYNAYYSRFKKTYHVFLQLESVAVKGKGFPRVAALVEAMFMAEVKNMLLTAGHDIDRLKLPLTLDVTRGGERCILMRGTEQELKAGDMFIRDQEAVISSIVYGPDAYTAIQPSTRKALFVVYAPAGVSAAQVQAHLEEIEELAGVISPGAKRELLEIKRGQ